MRVDIKNRIARLEKFASDQAKKRLPCNCRFEIRAHNAACLQAILNGLSRVCPAHGFRQFFGFMHAAQWITLLPEDNPFCPCPPHPWREYLLSKGPHTWEMRYAAKTAPSSLVPYNVEENLRRLAEIKLKYFSERQEWIERTGRSLPSQEEILKFQNEQAHNHGYPYRRKSL